MNKFKISQIDDETDINNNTGELSIPSISKGSGDLSQSGI